MGDLLYKEGNNEEVWAYEDVPAVMRAVKIKGDGTYQFDPEFPTPRVGDDDVLVKVARSGMCHTDVAAITGGMNKLMALKEGEFRIPGHEFAGRVVAIGENADLETWKGDRNALALALYGSCGKCFNCFDGQHNLCRSAVFTGIQTDGGFADYAVIPAEYVLQIPENVSLDDAFAVGDALLTAQHAINLAEVAGSDGFVAVLGAAGGLGIAVLTHLLAMKDHEMIIASDTRGVFLDMIKEKLGVHVINSMGENGPRNIAKDLKKMTDYGLTRVIDCVGSGGRIKNAFAAIDNLVKEGKLDQESFQAALLAEFANKGTVMDAISAVNKGGRVCVIGSCPKDFMLYPVGNWMGREVGVIGPWGGPYEVADGVLMDMAHDHYAPDSKAGIALSMLRGKECPFTADGFTDGYKALKEGKVMGRVYFNMDL